ncbi:hypothetical protein XMD543_000597 [Marinobacterium sp. xm-d-543]|jgi:hypothetical protein|uniref:hypothetical protein n=1 Tax=Marinobacterium sp. xm-d-543 TaxID=2497740 RepID=UPI001568C788|nr:hypothetical protein [Marinobacterium sp. xm-d-543]NRP46572.1 hypothetical protein [Marinobacterium sp. xm-d-543]
MIINLNNEGPNNVTCTITGQQALAFLYLCRYRKASLEELQAFGVKDPATIIWKLRMRGFLEIGYESAHYTLDPSTNQYVHVPYKYTMNWDYFGGGKDNDK